MKESDIVKGGVYEGSGTCCFREVDFIFDCNGKMRVHWFTPNTFPARWADGRMFHTPNRSCSLANFARWAKRKV